MTIESPNKESTLILASAESASCSTIKDEHRYYLLFGLWQVLGDESLDVTPKQGNTIRIKEFVSKWDAGITLLGGWAITLVRNTLQVEECKAGVRVLSSKETTFMDDLVKTDQRLSVTLYSGGAYEGRVLDIKETGLDFETVPPEDQDKKFDRVILRSGTILEGNVTGQSATGIVIQIGPQSKKISKAEIAKIEMGVQKEYVQKRFTIPLSDLKEIGFTHTNNGPAKTQPTKEKSKDK